MLVLFSCNRIEPSGFWADYHKDYLKKHLNNQELRGGYRAVYWKADSLNTFNPNEIIEYATKKGWSFVDSVNISNEDLKAWQGVNGLFFPLSSDGFNKNPTTQHNEYECFFSWINTEQNIYMFKTGWIMIEQGTDESNDVNGFVVISNKGDEMSVYHLWGE
ncbi:MAG: hypothetical protein H6544_07900 [Prevotellaceae bacterium]|nr:hypothetical protein [Prevotellaceae bacterium]